MKHVAVVCPEVPDHLGADGRRLYSEILTEYAICDTAGLTLLGLAASAADRLAEAREILTRDGLTTTSASGNLRPHPAIGIEKAARSALVAAIRELHLDIAPPQRHGRPTKSVGWKG